MPAAMPTPRPMVARLLRPVPQAITGTAKTKNNLPHRVTRSNNGIDHRTDPSPVARPHLPPAAIPGAIFWMAPARFLQPVTHPPNPKTKSRGSVPPVRHQARVGDDEWR